MPRPALWCVATRSPYVARSYWALSPDDAKGFREILDLPPLPGLLPVAGLPRHLIAV